MTRLQSEAIYLVSTPQARYSIKISLKHFLNTSTYQMLFLSSSWRHRAVDEIYIEFVKEKYNSYLIIGQSIRRNRNVYWSTMATIEVWWRFRII